MSKGLKDTDYMYISTRVRSMENQLLTRERMERMLEARTNEEAAKVLSECGYTGLEPLTAANLEHALARVRENTFRELADASPNPQLVDVFRVKYDYHNAKALIKCAETNQDASRLMIDAGRVPAEDLLLAFRQQDFSPLPDDLSAAIREASDLLSATGDPQKCDFYLDRAYYKALSALSDASHSSFLQGYVRLMIDAANLGAVVRVMRMKKGAEFLRAVLVEGGNVPPDTIEVGFSAGRALEDIFSGDLLEAAAAGAAAAKGGRQTDFEKACDNAVNRYLQGSQMIPFGDAVPVAYAAAKENEITAVRIILSGRLSGVPIESIRERLRESYV